MTKEEAALIIVKWDSSLVSYKTRGKHPPAPCFNLSIINFEMLPLLQEIRNALYPEFPCLKVFKDHRRKPTPDLATNGDEQNACDLIEWLLPYLYKAKSEKFDYAYDTVKEWQLTQGLPILSLSKIMTRAFKL